MNWKIGSAVGALGAILAAALIANAAPGDVLVKLNSTPTTLDAAQKAKASQALLAVFPSANAGTVQTYYCARRTEEEAGQQVNNVYCWGTYQRSIPRDDFILEAAQGASGQVVSYAGGTVTFNQKIDSKKADTAAKTKIGSFANAICGVEADLSTIVDYRCQRSNNESNDIVCQCAYVDTVDPETYMTLLQANRVLQTIDVVE